MLQYIPVTLNEFKWDGGIDDWQFNNGVLRCKLIDGKFEPSSRYLVGIKVDCYQHTLVIRLWENTWKLSPNELLDKSKWHSTFKEAKKDRWYCIEWATEMECSKLLVERLNYINKTHKCSFKMKLGAQAIVDSTPYFAYLNAFINKGNEKLKQEASDILKRLHILLKDIPFWKEGQLKTYNRISVITCLEEYGQNVLEAIKIIETRKHEFAIVDLI